MLRQNHAEKIHAVIPHFGYARADSMSEKDKRMPLSARLMAQLLGTAGATHAIVINMHSRQGQNFFPWPMDNLYVTRLLIEDIQKQDIRDGVLVAPDAGASKTIEFVGKKMGWPIAFVNKMRPAPNVSEVTSVVGDVRGRTCVLFDDILDTFGTIANGKKALIERGANPRVLAYGTHGILSGAAVENVIEAGFGEGEIVVSDTIPLPPRKRIPSIRQIPVAPILAKVIKSVHSPSCSVSENL